MPKEIPIEELIAEVEHHLVVLDEIQLPAAEEALQQVRDEGTKAWGALQRLEKRIAKDTREQ